MSLISHAVDRFLPWWRIPRRVIRLIGTPRVEVAVERRPARLAGANPRLVTIRRDGQRILLGLDWQAVRSRRELIVVAYSRAAVLVRLMADAAPSVAGFDASLADHCAGGLVGFCSKDRTAILVPDPEFFNSQGYAAARRLADEGRLPWRERSDEIVWRGSTTGKGRISDENMSPANGELIQRTRLCLRLKAIPGVDAAFSGLTQSSDPAGDAVRLQRAGLMAAFQPLSKWTRRRFALDIDGNTNAWANLFQRLVLGCCVIKVGSPGGFRQWYYDDLEPWHHFVPVAADMTDLAEKIDWCRSHPEECAEIAAAGQAFARSLTFESEIKRGARRIDQAFGAAASPSANSRA